MENQGATSNVFIKMEPEIKIESIDSDDNYFQPFNDNDNYEDRESCAEAENEADENISENFERKVKDEPQRDGTWESQGSMIQFGMRAYYRTQEKKFKCQLCTAFYVSSKTLQNHLLKKHPEALSHDELKKYRRESDRLDICPQCGIMTRTLGSHIKDVHKKERKFFCDLCEYSTNKKFYMRIHSLKHCKREKKFICQICDKKYSRLASLKKHMREFHNSSAKNARISP